MCYKMTVLKDGRTFPCQKCPKCIGRRVSAWSFRLLEEQKVSTSSQFITLTYDTAHVPISDNGKMVLRKSDLQLFFKRLRKAQCGNGISPIKYYACGEYGGRTKRPHYHIILFNANYELIQDAWSFKNQFTGKWSHAGQVHYGGVTGGSVGYTLKYMTKWRKDPLFKGMPKEFAVMSKGLGISYIQDEKNVNWHIGDLVNRMYCNAGGGVKIAMPRYYKERIYLENERSVLKEVFERSIHEQQLDKIIKQSLRDVRNEQAAIDAAYDRMYAQALKTTV